MNAQTQTTAVAAVKPRSVLIDMATRYGMEPAAFEQTLRATVVPANCTREQFAAFLLVAKEYNLNPLTKEIYAFPTRQGGIQPIVSIDGWCNLVNSQPQCDGIEFDDHLTQDGKLTAITARIWRKDRKMPVVVTEYMVECTRDTDTWKKYPRRMLRHKALIQCARYAFGFAGIVDPDEAERIAGAQTQRADRDDGPPAPDAPHLIDHQPSPPIVGEVVTNGEPERVPTADEITDIPRELRRTAPAKQTKQTQDQADGFDGDAWLNDLGGALAGCESVEQLINTQTEVMMPAKGKVSEELWKRAEKMITDTFTRVNQTVIGAG